MDGMSVEVLARFHPAVRDWFAASFPAPTRAQTEGWPAIARGESTLILAPTGSGKTLAAFLWCINRLMFEALPRPSERCRVLYVSPLKALAVDVERNLRAPIAGIASMAAFRGLHYEMPAVAVRTGDTPPRERARFRREPADILITTPESLYLLLTSQSARDAPLDRHRHRRRDPRPRPHEARRAPRALARAPRALVDTPSLQRIGLSATQRPLDEVARFLGGVAAARPCARRRRALRYRGGRRYGGCLSPGTGPPIRRSTHPPVGPFRDESGGPVPVPPTAAAMTPQFRSPRRLRTAPSTATSTDSAVDQSTARRETERRRGGAPRGSRSRAQRGRRGLVRIT